MPSRRCAVLNCPNISYSGNSRKASNAEQPDLSWHRFPRGENLRDKWIKSCKQKVFKVENARICSNHFSPDDFVRDFKNELFGIRCKRMLKSEAVPSINLDLPCIQIENKRKSSGKRKGSEVDLKGVPSRQNKYPAKKKRESKKFTIEITDDECEGDEDEASEKDKTAEFISSPLPLTSQLSAHQQEVTYLNDGSQNRANATFLQEIREIDSDDAFKNVETLPSKSDVSEVHDDKPIPHCPSPSHTDEGHPTACSDPGQESTGLEAFDSTSEFSRSAASVSTPSSTATDEPWCNPDCHYRQMFLRVVNDRARLEFKCKSLESEAAELSFQVQATNSIERDIRHAAAKVLTENQIAVLSNPNVKVKWKNQEIIEALMLRYHSMTTFHYLKRQKGLPMPEVPVLKRWIEGTSLGSGIPPRILQTLKIKCDDLPASEKLCVLSFNEFEVHKTLEYDEKKDRIIGPHEKMQIMMVSSLSGSWKQPVFVGMDCKLTKVSVLNVVNLLQHIGCTVVCFSTDCSASSIHLWKELGVTPDSPSFHHPFTNQPIVLVPDAPHLLRLLRDEFLTSGFEVDGSIVSREPIDALLHLNYLDVPCSKLNACHLVPGGNTILAAQLMSNTVGSSLIRQLSNESELAKCTGNFLKIVNHWFDLVNVSSHNVTSPFKSPYGSKREEQDQLLTYVKTMIFTLKCCKKPDEQPFQSGIVMLCNALPILIDIGLNHGIKSIATRFLNQDALSELCNLLKRFSKKDPFGRPSPLSVLSRMRLILLGEYPESCLDYATVSVLRRAQVLPSNDKDEPCYVDDSVVSNDPILDGLPPVTYDSRGYISLNVLKSIAGKLSFAYRQQYSNAIESPHYDFSLPQETAEVTASNSFLEGVVKMESIFNLAVASDNNLEKPNVVHNLVQKSKSLNLPVEVIRRFFKVRVLIFVQKMVSKMDQMWLKSQINERLVNTLQRSSTDPKCSTPPSGSIAPR